MQAPPVFQMTVRHFGAWRWLRVGLTAAAALTLVAWLVTVLQVDAARPVWAWALGALALLVSLGGGRQAPVALRWDGQAWFLQDLGGPRAGRASEPTAGHLSVAIDAGAGLLLRWVPRQGPARWVPVQRRGHEARWHALRCTLYGARPSADPLAGAAV